MGTRLLRKVGLAYWRWVFFLWPVLFFIIFEIGHTIGLVILWHFIWLFLPIYFFRFLFEFTLYFYLLSRVILTKIKLSDILRSHPLRLPLPISLFHFSELRCAQFEVLALKDVAGGQFFLERLFMREGNVLHISHRKLLHFWLLMFGLIFTAFAEEGFFWVEAFLLGRENVRPEGGIRNLWDEALLWDQILLRDYAFLGDLQGIHCVHRLLQFLTLAFVELYLHLQASNFGIFLFQNSNRNHRLASCWAATNTACLLIPYPGFVLFWDNRFHLGLFPFFLHDHLLLRKSVFLGNFCNVFHSRGNAPPCILRKFEDIGDELVARWGIVKGKEKSWAFTCHTESHGQMGVSQVLHDDGPNGAVSGNTRPQRPSRPNPEDRMCVAQ